ncbi:MAG: hypothetical protein ACETWQ_12765 [Phycisphaerae bacterium]
MEGEGERGGGPGGARAVFLGFDYGENDWVYVDVWRFRDGPPNALRGWGAKQKVKVVRNMTPPTGGGANRGGI